MLHVRRSERADGLVGALRELLAEPLPDPFAAEVVAVPTRGMERWLTQQLSTTLGARPGRSDGICANVRFPNLRALTDAAVAAASGIDPETDPWAPERATWPLLEIVDGALAEPWMRCLSDHLGGPGPDADPARRARRLGVVRHVAGLFDRYALHRPAMVRAWAAGHDVDAHGRPLAEDARWQPELWRRLRGEIAVEDPAARAAAACARMSGEPELLDLPDRLAAFGITRLPATLLAVLRAIAARRDVHVLVLHPSPALWDRVADATATAPPVVRRAEDPTAELPRHRLLASWGRDVRELQLVLAGQDAADHHHPAPAAAAPATLLERLQAAIREDRPPAAPEVLDPADRSVEVHACHGRSRQVEILRDAVLHLLASDPTLEPRDVLVMCPDIEAFAPLVQAAFGAGDPVRAGGDPLDDDPLDADPAAAGPRPPDLRVRLADRSLRQTNPVLGAVSAVLELAGGRVTASQVLDLADREPVRRRFRLDDDDLARIEEWVAAAGVRWGLDAEARRPFQLDRVPGGTWRTGLDRVLLGVTMTEDAGGLFGGVLPLDDVESGAIDLAGRLAELVDRLAAALDALGGPQPVDAWAAAIADAADLLTATSERDAWQRSELSRVLDDLVTEATRDGRVGQVDLRLEEVRDLLAERLQGRPTRTGFRTGHLTVCTLVPMRSVPHRVVCLLGLDDGVFPRRAPRDGDDLVLDDPHVGDRDGRSEDRQLLLDALMAASDRLVVTFTGNDERTGTPQPPAVPLGELLDAVDDAARTADGRPGREQVLVRHPLQPFDPRNFREGELVPGRPWSFDRVTLAGARELLAERAERGPFLAAPLAPIAAPLVAVEDLVRFVEHPVRAFLRGRLGFSVGARDDEVEDALPVELDALQTWAVGRRMLDARLAGTDPDACVAAELARGVLPPGQPGAPVIASVAPAVEAIVAEVRALRGGTAEPVSVDVLATLPNEARTVSGTIAGVCGDVVRTVTFSRLGPKQRLAAWVRLLALTAARPERPWSALTVGRAPAGAGVAIAVVDPLGDDPATRRAEALAHLAVIVDLHDRGLREPLPIACRSSAAYAAAAHAGRRPVPAAEDKWRSGFNWPKEDQEPEHVLVRGEVVPFATVHGEPPRPDERGPGWDDSDPSRFGRYARRLWSGLLDREQVMTR